MKPAALLSLVMLFTPLLSQASLGGVESSVQEDQNNFHGSQTNFYRHPTYRIHEIAHDRLTVREFVTLDGKVFAVAWKGPAHPDLSGILGEHFQDYKTAMENSRSQRRGRAPISAHENGLNIEVGGHIRSIHGRVWIPSLLPGGFDLSEIK
jgi:Protein of unknown function (DUF2844)